METLTKGEMQALAKLTASAKRRGVEMAAGVTRGVAWATDGAGGIAIETKGKPSRSERFITHDALTTAARCASREGDATVRTSRRPDVTSVLELDGVTVVSGEAPRMTPDCRKTIDTLRAPSAHRMGRNTDWADARVDVGVSLALLRDICDAMIKAGAETARLSVGKPHEPLHLAARAGKGGESLSIQARAVEAVLMPMRIGLPTEGAQ